jgi:transposase
MTRSRTASTRSRVPWRYSRPSPGWDAKAAETIIAETGADMARVPSASQLCAWAGVAPANHESAGKRRPAGTRQGGSWLRRALIGRAAKAASRTKDTHLAAQYRQIAVRRGPNKATVAVAHSILFAAWHTLTTGQTYNDLGADYLSTRNRDAEIRRLVKRLQTLGQQVELAPAV